MCVCGGGGGGGARQVFPLGGVYGQSHVAEQLPGLLLPIDNPFLAVGGGGGGTGGKGTASLAPPPPPYIRSTSVHCQLLINSYLLVGEPLINQ